MAIRPPRPPRRRARPGNARDILLSVLASTAILLFALRALMHIADVRPWVTGWEIVNLPTGLVVGPLERAEVLQHHIINQLTVADIVALVVVTVAAMVVLASLAIRRPV
jgi:hypothetical protein